MFGSNKSKESNPRSSSVPTQKGTNSLNTLVKGTVIEGNIKTESDIRVDGTIKGTLECNAKVIIGPTGYVEGEIKCLNAVVEGRFEGNLAVKEILSLKETATINGDASYDKLIVQQGAEINAAIRRNNRNSGNGHSHTTKASEEIVKKIQSTKPREKVKV